MFIWWFSTGIVLLLDGLPHGALRWSHWLSSLLALTAFAALAHTARADRRVAGAYCAFTCALLVWGWHELSFLTGWITGPRKRAAAPGAPAGRASCSRCARSCGTSWRILAVGGWPSSRHLGRSPTRSARWTFLVLWVMRISAKLNLFLGVRNLSEEFLPPHLAYLQSYFRRRAMNPLCPFSVLGASAVLAAGWSWPRPSPPATPARGRGHRAGGHAAGAGHRRAPAAGAAHPVDRAVALGAAQPAGSAARRKPAAATAHLENHDDLLRAR